MKRPLRFCKMVGAGNDFILVDARRRPFEANAPQTARRWCDRTQGIGADGLLLVLPAQGSDARMRIFNPDGSEASMCGNGLRCVAWYLATPNGKAQSFSIQTGAGVLKAQVVGKERVRSPKSAGERPPTICGGRVRIFLSTPRQWRLHLKLSIRGKPFTVHSVNTGVPHAVVLVKPLNEIDLPQFGAIVRRHRLFKPAGTNVNLVRIDSPRQISIRTYERGVEAETLACGTGAAASVVILAALGHVRPPVQVKTASGEELTVDFGLHFRMSSSPSMSSPTRSGIGLEGRLQRGSNARLDSRPRSGRGQAFRGNDRWEALSLEGPARILFQGEIPL